MSSLIDNLTVVGPLSKNLAEQTLYPLVVGFAAWVEQPVDLLLDFALEVANRADDEDDGIEQPVLGDSPVLVDERCHDERDHGGKHSSQCTVEDHEHLGAVQHRQPFLRHLAGLGRLPVSHCGTPEFVYVMRPAPSRNREP